MSAARVVAVGSPHGADAIAWDAVRVLTADLGEHARAVEVRCLDRPGPGLVEALAGADGVVVVDAVCDARPMGEVIELEPDALVPAPGLSSHGLGVADALSLAEALGIAPQRLWLLGIAVEPEASLATAWAAYIERGRGTLAARVRRAVEDWAQDQALGPSV